jgi:hypothetical protein
MCRAALRTGADRRATIAALGSELTELEAEISCQRLIRERATYRLEQALREGDRLARHIASATREEGSA